MKTIIPIKENHLFSKVYAKGKKASGKNIVVYALKNYRSLETKLGITTSKKIGNAVQRSRARRLIREAYRLFARDHQWSHPYLIVVVARSSIVQRDRKMQDVSDELALAFRKLGLVSEENQ